VEGKDKKERRKKERKEMGRTKEAHGTGKERRGGGRDGERKTHPLKIRISSSYVRHVTSFASPCTSEWGGKTI
jgi:hypothetical protein